MDYEKQTEDFGGEGVGEYDRLLMGSKEGTYCMVHWALYLHIFSKVLELSLFKKKSS